MLDKMTEFGQRAAKWMGEKSAFGFGPQDSDYNRFQKTFEFESLNNILHFDGYDRDTGVYFNKNSQGFILEASLLMGANDETTTILTSIIIDVLPKNADLQFILWGSDKIGNILDHFESTRSKKGEIFEWLAKRRTDFLKEGAYKSLVQQGTFILRNFRLFICVSMPAKQEQDLTSDLIRLREDIASSLLSIHISTRSLVVEEFISVINDILHPAINVYPTKQNWNPYDSLSTQLVDPEFCLHIRKNCLKIEKDEEMWEVRALSVKEYPEKPVLWKMEDIIGQLYNISRQIPSTFLFSFTIRLMNQENASLGNVVKTYDTQQNAKNSSADLMSYLSKKYNDLQFLRERLSQGDKVVKTSCNLILFSKEKDASSTERKVRDLYQASGWTLKKTAYLQFQSFLSCLPMRMTEGMFQDMKRFGRLRTMTAFNAANVSPIIGEWKGTETPIMLLPGRRGQVAGFSPFDNKEGNYNIAIAAASGKGKSVFTQDYITGLLGSGGRVWVIDIGRSYEKTCKVLGGTFVEFSPNNPICLNPFTHIKNFDESLELLKPLMAAMARPTSGVTDEENVYLEKSIKAAWQEHGKKTTISTVANWLKNEENKACHDLAHLLYPFTKEGMYGRYFEGDANINLDGEFIVLELQALEKMKILRRIVMMLLMFQVSQVMYLGGRTQTKTLILEEIWKHFKGKSDGMSDFIEEIARTVRRFTGSLVAIAQSINDYFENSTTTAVFDNCDFKIVLGQTEEAIDQLKKNERFAMNPMTERLYKSLRKTDEYSECIIKSPSGISIHRIILDPYFRILSSSKGEEFDAVNSLQKQGYSLRNAVSKVAEKFI
ncbi:MAG: type IV secretion system protein TraC [Gammaproteobacteria bacterium]